MSQLQAFLNANTIENITDEVVVSERFKNEKGALLKFKIKAINESQMEEINKACIKSGKKGKFDFDINRFNRMVVIRGCVDPNFEDTASIKQVGCVTPQDYVKKVLLPGEISTLAEQIQQLSGYADLEELKEQAKN